MKISLIVPCYNEEEALPIFYRETKNVLETMPCEHEFVFINDGSRDRTLAVLKELAVPFLFQKFRKGSGNVCRILQCHRRLRCSDGC